ncbi:competence type IV pilus minor pilin ComGF [Lysinibacillus sp. 54212]|uniref:competence type IV pilus minor pilin ComGF n=1 Tax=Lysinibacillus sp. 54212 TaxID=3119829 RepID=UPI002FCBA65B
MYRFKWKRVGNESGFTLLEAILHLMLFVIFSHLIFLITQAYYQLTKIEDARIEMDWEGCVYDINTYLSMGGEVTVSNEGKNITIVKDDRIVVLRFNNNILWRNEKGGNETILTDVKRATFSLNQSELTLNATLENGAIKERIFIVEAAIE